MKIYTSIGAQDALRHKLMLVAQPMPLVFVTVSGSHLFGFSSQDSDWDLRGCHAVPAEVMLGLDATLARETIEDQTYRGGSPEWRQAPGDTPGTIATSVLDELVTHDARKYFHLLIKNNGYVLEQLYSPLVVFDGGHLEELRTIGRDCITSQHSLHSKGFGYGEWTKFVDNPTKTVKRILYVFRVLMSGIGLMHTGEVQAKIVELNDSFNCHTSTR